MQSEVGYERWGAIVEYATGEAKEPLPDPLSIAGCADVLGRGVLIAPGPFHRQSSERIVRGRERTAFASISPSMRNCSLVSPDADCTGTEPAIVTL